MSTQELGSQPPTFLVVGAARSGTTAVAEALRLHPDVFVTQPKEPHYFAFHGQSVAFQGPGDDAAINQVAVTALDDYLRLFPSDRSFEARGDCSVTTLYYASHAVDEIRRINSNMRLVVLLREPVERAFSSFTYLRARGVEPESDFLRAVDLEPERQQRRWHHMWHYTGMSQYARDLEILQKGLGQEQVRAWFYDDLVADYARVIQEIHTFIGVTPLDNSQGGLPRVNVSGVPRVRLAQQAVLWATRHERVRSSLKKIIGLPARERIRGAVLRPTTPPAVAYAELRPRFEADLSKLRALVQSPAPRWTDTRAPSL